MPSKRRHEGYLLIDQRASPGTSPEQAAAAGLPAGAHRGLFEAPTYTCSHCQTVVVLNPLRTRAREWCAKCDHYICDRCSAVMAASGECKTFEEIIYETQLAADKQAAQGEPHG